MPSHDVASYNFTLPDDIPAIADKGRASAKEQIAHQSGDLELLAASFYRVYWMATRRIRTANKDLGKKLIDEDFHRPLLYTAIKAAASICEMIRYNRTPPNEETFDRLLEESPKTIFEMHLNAKVLSQDAFATYGKYLNGRLGTNLIDCLELSMTEAERAQSTTIKRVLKQNLMISEPMSVK